MVIYLVAVTKGREKVNIPMRVKVREHLPLTNEEIVYQYFKLMENNDLYAILDLFGHDAVVHEPFSKVKGLHGRSEIEPFLKVAMMANSNLKRVVDIDKPTRKSNEVTAYVTFEKGDKVKGRFIFEFEDSAAGKKIRSLHIKFL